MTCVSFISNLQAFTIHLRKKEKKILKKHSFIEAVHQWQRKNATPSTSPREQAKIYFQNSKHTIHDPEVVEKNTTQSQRQTSCMVVSISGSS